jgi:hypothetical protein
VLQLGLHFLDFCFQSSTLSLIGTLCILILLVSCIGLLLLAVVTYCAGISPKLEYFNTQLIVLNCYVYFTTASEAAQSLKATQVANRLHPQVGRQGMQARFSVRAIGLVPPLKGCCNA